MTTELLQDRQSLLSDIQIWKTKRKAVILAHNYQLGEVQDCADFSGDSLELARQAAGTGAETIVFCGVHFMAESAKILSPNKTVLLPVPEAGCPMADMITVSGLRQVKANHRDAAVVAYVNSAAEIKAESDYCCTSANAVALVQAIPERKIIFVPDKNLGQWVAKHTDKEIILYDGFCATHDQVTVNDIEQARATHPEACLLVHPECRPDVCDRADEVLSTSQMIRFAQQSSRQTFLIGTETGLLHTLRQANPNKLFYPVQAEMICPNMKLTGLGDVLHALKNNKTIIDVPALIRQQAQKALEAMLQYG